MRIKIFEGTNLQEIENEVNYFIQNRYVVDIKQSITKLKDGAGNVENHIVMTVLYNLSDIDYMEHAMLK